MLMLGCKGLMLQQSLCSNTAMNGLSSLYISQEAHTPRAYLGWQT